MNPTLHFRPKLDMMPELEHLFPDHERRTAIVRAGYVAHRKDARKQYAELHPGAIIPGMVLVSSVTADDDGTVFSYITQFTTVTPNDVFTVTTAVTYRQLALLTAWLAWSMGQADAPKPEKPV